MFFNNVTICVVLYTGDSAENTKGIYSTLNAAFAKYALYITLAI